MFSKFLSYLRNTFNESIRVLVLFGIGSELNQEFKLLNSDKGDEVKVVVFENLKQPYGFILAF